MTVVTEEESVAVLRAAGCVFAEAEAAMIAASVRGDGSAIARLVARRATGEPLEQVVGYADLGDVRVRVRPGVFVPRVRSELLVRLAAAHARPGAVVVDLCCGTGALGLAVLRRQPGIRLYASDLDPVSVACARDNLGENGQVFEGDLFAALPPLRADVLIANVPYVATRDLPLLPAEAREHEPRAALDGGDDGLDVFRRVAAEAPRWLAAGGVLLSEITAAQAGAATEAVRRAGLRPELAYDEERQATVVIGVG